jgi:DNA-directed RNA polymerase specialized sigma24 family protein
VPPRRRRAGYRPGQQLSPELQGAIANEVAKLDAIGDDLEVIQAVGNAMSAWDDALEELGEPRLRAIGRLRALGWSYDRIAEATELSKARVAQLAREARRRRFTR